MAEEMVIRRWCDPCQAAGKRTEATRQWRIVLHNVGPGANAAPRLLDTCEPCAAPLYTAANLARTLGRPDPATARVSPPRSIVEEEQETCPLCGADMKPRYLNKHLLVTHQARVIQPRRCPDCRQSMPNTSAMIRHRTRRHGYDHRAAMLAIAKERTRG